MIERLLRALIDSKNEAADDVLLEALRLGKGQEKHAALTGLMRRQTVRGMGGVIGMYDSLPDDLKLTILSEIKTLHHALRECGRSSKPAYRLAAMKLIALGRQGKLSYVLSENLHNGDEALSKAATEALVGLARWIATETHALQAGREGTGISDVSTVWTATTGGAPAGKEIGAKSAGGRPVVKVERPRTNLLSKAYLELLSQRPEIEATIARAMDVHRGRHGSDLLRAALLLCDWPGSKTLAILHSSKHGGQSAMVRRLQQPPASEHVEAFLLGASHGQLRSHFGAAFAHIDEAPVLDALLRKTHWLKDHNLQLCMHQVSRGVWWSDADLKRDSERRLPADVVRIGEWIAASGCHDVMQDERLDLLRQQVGDSVGERLRLLRIACRRKMGSSVKLLQKFLEDPDERIKRMAAREIVRRRPPDFENILIRLMTGAPESVRRVVSRSIGQAGFENYWQKFDRLNKPTRKQAGKAMLKILPDGLERLERRLNSGPVEQRLKAMQMAHELELGPTLRPTLIQLCADPNSKLRSKAVAIVGQLGGPDDDVLVERLLGDTDARVRANAVETLEGRRDPKSVITLARLAKSAHSRERANAIKALASLRVATLSTPLSMMLRDPRSDHRISAMWVLNKIGWWQLLGEVGRLAKSDGDLRVRRYALAVLRGVAELAQAQKTAKAG